MVLGLLLLEKAPDTSHRSYLDAAVRFGAAMLVMDAWQYSFHRVFHEVPWLYKHVHFWHHTISIPYSYGALYQHPVEMLIMDTLSGLVAVEATGAPPRACCDVCVRHVLSSLCVCVSSTAWTAQDVGGTVVMCCYVSTCCLTSLA